MASTTEWRHLLKFVVPALAIIVCCFTVLAVVLHNAHKRSFDPDYINQVNLDPEGMTLQHVFIVHRHSIRAPYHLSNWSDPKIYPMGLGYLTATGKQQSLTVGHVFRKFYRNYLGESPREVWARSSTYPRCFETEQLLLSTLYPPRGLWDFGYLVQPIPIIMVPNGNDVYIDSCKASVTPDFRYMYEETDPALKADGFNTVHDFLRWVTRVSGFPEDNSAFYDGIIDGFYAQKYNGLAIPSWAEQKWKSMDWAMRRLSFEIWKEYVPYYGQYMGKTIANRTAEAAKGNLKERLSIMSYHDTTLQALLNALSLDFTALYPSFLAALHFQLYKRSADGEHFVRIMYHQGLNANGLYREAVELTSSQCPFPKCSLQQFVTFMENIYSDLNRTFCNHIDTAALL